MFASHIYKNSGLVNDPNFNNVSLLLHGDGTNGSQNNTFLDSSSNNFTITRNGTPAQGTFSPYGNSWSVYFDGSGDYLDIPSNGAFQFGTSAFTIEFFVYLNQYKLCNFIDFRSGAINQVAPLLYLTATGSLRYWVSGTDQIISTNNIPLNEWVHIALSRTPTSTVMFVNGIQTGSTYADNNSYILSPCRIGTANNGLPSDTTNLCVNGYISNVRVIKGMAIYLSSFSVPTSNLTSVLGTSLLTCQSNRFIDNSSNNFTITATGTPSVQPNSPFNSTSEYSIVDNGGSGYFNGSTDYLTISDSEQFNLAANNFTIECWVYFNSSVDQYYFGQIQSLGSNRSFCHAVISGKYFFEVRSGTTSYSIQSSSNITTNEWTHLAAVRNGNTITLYRNGISIGSVSVTGVTVNNSTLLVGIGGAGDYNIAPLNGYISNARIVNGTAIYTSNFNPPTTPVTSVASTSLLCNFTNSGIFDNTEKNNLLTVGTSRISTAQKKYGSGSMLFNGSSDYIRTFCPTGTHQFRTGNFTIECWAYCTNLAGGNSGTMQIIDFRASALGELRPTLAVSSSCFIYFTSGTIRISSGTISTNTWYHVAVVRSSGSTNLYVDGINVGATYADTNNYLDGTPIIGNYIPSPTYGFAGYIDDIRITKGVARYTANFTPPTQAFPNL